jgi:hypothetical protein
VLQAPAVDSRGDPEQRCTRVRRFGADDVSLKDAETLGRAVDGVSFWHGGVSCAERRGAGPRGIPPRVGAA